MADYSVQDIQYALRNVGISEGDVVFTHSNIGFFGRLEGASSATQYYEAFKSAIQNVIGETGTWIVPTFSYSFCKGQDFNVEETPGVCGALSEMLRKDTSAFRSLDANFSVAAIGGDAEFFTKNAISHSFGQGSFFDRLLQKNAKICNLNFDAGSTFIHYVEKQLGVPYRYDKGFSGTLISPHATQEATFYHFVYDLEKPHHAPDFTKFDRKAKELGLVKCANLGKGQVLAISASGTFELIQKELSVNPNFLIKG